MNKQSYAQQATLLLKELTSKKTRGKRQKALIKEINGMLTAAQVALEADDFGKEDEVSDNQRLTKLRLQLVSDILGTNQKEHPKCEAFSSFLAKFIEFANGENLYSREAEAVLTLQAIEEELRILGRVSLFREKTIIAVAGGFSSGKSSLLTSFFDPAYDVRLPIGVNPVTAITTYIASCEDISVIGFPARGGSLEISSDIFAQLNHEFLTALRFDIRSILPFIALGTPWREKWEHLCFVDTPGYNAPAMEGYATASDDKTTVAALRQADALIWVIGLDANGEISTKDLELLQAFSGDLPLAVIVNKADQRPPSQVSAVVEQIRETLEFSGIPYKCISAYSSTEGREYQYVGMTIFEFMASMNRPPIDRDHVLRNLAIDVVSDYIKTFDAEIYQRNTNRREIHSLELDLFQLGLFDEDGNKGLHEVAYKAKDRFGRLLDYFNIKEVEDLRAQATILLDDLERLFAEPW